MAIKVLVVLDGSYRFEEPFAPGGKDFTFTVLVNTLREAGFQVTRAHRDSIGEPWVSQGKVDIQAFNFASSVNLLDYNAIWMIGHHGRNWNFEGSTGLHALTSAEIEALTNYMNQGGGIFATGDHDSIGADMCGFVPRLRVMRAWFGPSDPGRPSELSGIPENFPPLGAGRADTVRRNPLGDYDINNDGANENFVYFENQSDSIPQPISPATSPIHPILRKDGTIITVFPDHMHEGQTLGYDDLLGISNPYTRPLPAGVPAGFVEFPTVDGNWELPQVIATGESMGYSQKYGQDGTNVIDDVEAIPKQVNTLCAYNGWNVGVGRIVTGSTFHHYIDINLIGDTDIVNPQQISRTGPDAVKGQGFNYPGAEATFAAIKAVYVNITNWIAKITPTVEIILERSTFSLDEVNAGSVFDGVVKVTVDGLKPSQFPGGPITTLSPNATQLRSWAPEITFESTDSGMEIIPISIDSSTPTLLNRVQRFTFSYRLTFINEDGFNFLDSFKNYRIVATLRTTASTELLTDNAILQLVKTANPFMLDLAGGNSTSWLSSDVRTFTVIEGQSKFGINLPLGATKSQAYTFIQSVLQNITETQFENLSILQADSALSPFATTTSGSRVYNFAVARVRLNGESAMANQVRVFFRIFTSQTTAALTYRHPEGGEPLDGYRKNNSANPIAIPGISSTGNSWVSYPFFAENRSGNPAMQSDPNNVKNITPVAGTEVSTFFGALIDSNINEAYLPVTPGNLSGAVGLPTLLMGEHQCLVAQIEFAGTPIPDGSKPNTSDKLAQRNLAISAVANPGLSPSRMAFHTFELEATPGMITDSMHPNELMLQWEGDVPEGTTVKITIPTWNSNSVLELADKFYNLHDLIVEDPFTIALPGGGTQYIPIPRCQYRQTGIISVQLPLGIVKGQRYNLVIRQITNKKYQAKLPSGSGRYISQKEAMLILQEFHKNSDMLMKRPKKEIQKVYHLPGNQILYTDTAFINNGGEKALLYQAADPKLVAEIRSQEGKWREVIGAFQFGIEVSVKEEMLQYHLQLLSLFKWKLEKLSQKSPWYKTLVFYLELLSQKVQGLGENPFSIAPSADGSGGVKGIYNKPEIPQVPPNIDPDLSHGQHPYFEPQNEDWLNESKGLLDPEKSGSRAITGKISGLLFDHFGDFEGFILENYSGIHQRFFSQEKEIESIVRNAWQQRFQVTVISVSALNWKVRRVLIN